MMSRRHAVLALTFLSSLTLRAAEPELPYQTKYRVINVHRHCAIATEAAVRAELGVILIEKGQHPFSRAKTG